MKKYVIGAALSLIMAAAAQAQEVDVDRVDQTIRRLAADYAGDPMAIPGQYGLEVGGQVWTIDVTEDAAPGRSRVEVRRGEPTVPTFVYTVGPAVFDQIESGQMSAYTAMVAAFQTDVTPMDIRTVHDYRPDEDFTLRFRSFSFHFFTPGRPEVVPMGVDHSRFTHGAQAVVGYYAEGLRSGWMTLLPGQHANEDPRSQVDPWVTLMFVVEGGSGKAEIGDQTIDLDSRSMIYIPPNTKHHFWNPGDTPVEMMMVVFGKDS